MPTLNQTAAMVDSIKTVFPSPPRGCFFSTPRHPYFFDTNTGEIVELDPVSDRILKALGKPELGQTLMETIAQHGEEAVRREVAEIVRSATGRTPPLFTRQEPEAIEFHLDYDSYKKKVTTELSQLVLSITDACNLACRYCCYSGKYPDMSKRADHIMSKEIMDSAVDHFVRSSAGSNRCNLGFYGGEPLLLFESIKYAIRRVKTEAKGGPDTFFGITTNLVALRPEMIPFLREHEVDIYVSLDGPPDVHDRYRVFPDGSGTHDLVMSNLRKIHEYDPEYYFRHVHFTCVAAPPFRFREIVEYFENCYLVGFPNVVLLVTDVDRPEICFGDCQDPNFFVKAEALELRKEYYRRVLSGEINRDGFRNRFLRLLFDVPQARIYRRTCFSKEPPRRVATGGICIPAQRKLYARWDGAYFPCEKIPEHENFRIGDCSRGLDVERAYRLCVDFVASTPEECRKCWAVYVCGQMCFRDLYTDGKFDPEIKAKYCGRLRGQRLQNMASMCSILEQKPDAFEYLNQYEIS